MTEALHLGPETPGRPAIRGICVIKVAGQPAPGYAWCEGPGRSVSLAGSTPADAARMRPLIGGLARWQIERREIEYWRSYTPPQVSLAERLRRAMAAMRGV